MSKKTELKNKPQRKNTLSDKNFFIVLLLVFIVLNILNFDPKLFLGGDNAHYLTLAKSLLNGHGYRDIFVPNAPVHTQYPPGFPLLLIPGLILFGNHFFFIKIIILVMSISAFYLFYKIIKINTIKQEWILSLSLFSFCPLIIMYSHYLLSEIPYLFFSLLTIYLLEKFGLLNRNNILYFIIAILSLVFSYYIRTIGISLIIACIGYFLYKKQYKQFVIITFISIIFILIWQIYVAKHGGGGYFNQFLSRNPYDAEAGRISFAEFITRVIKNLRLYTLEIYPKILIPSLQNMTWIRVFGFLFSILTLIGFTNKLKTTTIIEIYLVFFLVVTFTWPDVWTGDRFILPVIPFLFYYLISGLLVLTKKNLIIPISVTFICLILVVSYHLKNTPENFRNFRAFLSGDYMAGYSQDWQHYFQTLEWIKNNTATSDIIISRKPQFTYLLANRKSFTYPFSTDENKFFDVLNKHRPQYILFDRFYWTGTTLKYLGPIINKYQDKFQIIFNTKPPEMIVLKIDSSLLNK